MESDSDTMPINILTYFSKNS